MKQTQTILMSFFVGIIALSLMLVVLYETDILESGTAAGNNQTEFLLTTVMELLTLGCAFLALRMFKFPQVHQTLVLRKAPALLKFGLLRLTFLELPMLLNTLFYYMYMKPTFGYLAIILVLCLPFVVPTMGRCEAETSSDDEEG